MRRRTSPTGFRVPVHRFLHDAGIGPDRFFGDPGHQNRAEAERQWRECRREVWAQQFRFHIPAAAAEFDELTKLAWPLLWSSWNSDHFDAAEVLEAVADDLAAVDTFEKNDPQGSAEIADYIEAWRADLRTVREAAEACAEFDDPLARGRLGIHHRITTAAKYGSAAQEMSA